MFYVGGNLEDRIFIGDNHVITVIAEPLIYTREELCESNYMESLLLEFSNGEFLGTEFNDLSDERIIDNLTDAAFMDMIYDMSIASNVQFKPFDTIDEAIDCLVEQEEYIESLENSHQETDEIILDGDMEVRVWKEKA